MSDIVKLPVMNGDLLPSNDYPREIRVDEKGGPPGKNGIPKTEMFYEFAHQYMGDASCVNHKSLDGMAKHFRDMIISQYMLKTPIFEMSDEELFKDISKSGLDNLYVRMSAISNRIMKNGKNPYTYRVNSDTHAIYIKYGNFQTNKYGCKQCDINVQIFNNVDRYMVSSTFIIFVGMMGLVDMSLGPFVYAENPAYARKVLTNILSKQGKFPQNKPVPIISDMTSMFVMYNAMEKIYMDVCGNNIPNPTNVTYSDFEMSVYRDLVNKELGHNVGLYATNLIGVHNPNYSHLMQDSLCSPDIPIFLSVPPIVNTIPKIAFSPRELTRIFNYVSKIGMDIDGETVIDLTKILSNVKYGTWFRFSKPFVDENEGEMYLHWDCYPDYNWIRFYLIRYNSNGTTAYALVDFCDTDKFVGPNNLSHINIDLMWGNVDNLSDNIRDALDAMVPFMMHDTKDLVYMLLDFVKIFIVMAERPTRTKVLRVLTPKSEVDEEQKTRKYRRSYEESDDPDERDYVITRILKSTSEAKKMVDEARKSQGIHRQARYVVESWERCGYWRKVPGTDRMVYIGPTTCKRHLPLTDDKEIHIKL